MQPNKDGDKLLSIIYKSFLERRKQGFSKADAAFFEDGYFSSDTYLSKWNVDDLEDAIGHLHDLGMVKRDINDNFKLTEMGINYMENRFKDRLDKLLDYISKFVQLMP